MSKIYVGDINTEFIGDTGTNLSTATVTNIEVLKPDGTIVTWAGSVHDTQYVKYVSQSGDLDMAGTYQRQVYVELSDWSGRGETTSFVVYDRFK